MIVRPLCSTVCVASFVGALGVLLLRVNSMDHLFCFGRGLLSSTAGCWCCARVADLKPAFFVQPQRDERCFLLNHGPHERTAFLVVGVPESARSVRGSACVYGASFIVTPAPSASCHRCEAGGEGSVLWAWWFPSRGGVMGH